MRYILRGIADTVFAILGYYRAEYVDGAGSFIDSIDNEINGSQYYFDSMWAAFRNETKVPIERVCLLETECEGGQMMYMFVDVMELE